MACQRGTRPVSAESSENEAGECKRDGAEDDAVERELQEAVLAPGDAPVGFELAGEIAAALNCGEPLKRDLDVAGGA
jgi:hypothetical protein